MPLLQLYTIPPAKIALWRTDESYDLLSATAHPADLESSLRFSNPIRRTEHLAARAALRHIIPDAEVAYNKNGAPALANSSKYVSISHCRGMAGAIVSGMPCAIDIENTGRNFNRASSKFVSPSESVLPEAGHRLFLPAVWCAKEAMYKYSGIPGLDFIRDLKVLSSDLCKPEVEGLGSLTARIGDSKEIVIHCRTAGEFIVCYITGECKIK